MVKAKDILNYAFSKARAVYLSNPYNETDDFQFYEIGIQQSFPKYPKGFVRVFEQRDKDMFGFYFRPAANEEQELYATYNWIEKSSTKGWSRALCNEETDFKVIEQLIDQSYQLVVSTLTKKEQAITESLKNETNNFLYFDTLGREFKDPSKSIYIGYQMTAEISAGAKCIIRFEDNAIIDWPSTDRKKHKDPLEWRSIIDSALSKITHVPTPKFNADGSIKK